jgi:hypothetical protein
VFQHHTQLSQQVCIDVLAGKNVVNVSALAVNLSCYPDYGTMLLNHNLLDSLSDVQIVHNAKK